MKYFNPEKELRKIQGNNKNKIVVGIIFLLIIVAIGTSFALYQVQNKQDIVFTKVGEFTTKDIQLAVLIDDVESKNFPEKDSGYVFDSLICENGTIGEWDNVNWNLLVTFSKPDKCTVKFITLETGAMFINSLISSNPETMNNSDPDGNVRYMGVDPNNYVNFNNETWRIIGVFDNKIKIIKDSALPVVLEDNGIKIGSTSNYVIMGSIAASVDYFYWDANGTNDWNNATLKTYLNGTYYNSINVNFRDMISNSTWYLGGLPSTDYNNLRLDDVYENERSNNIYQGNHTTINEFIGLPYTSDYLYTTTNEDTITVGSYISVNSNSYMESYNGYTITSNLDRNGSIFVFMSTGAYSYFYFESSKNDDKNGLYAQVGEPKVYPTLYLNSNVYFTSGDGTKENPYQLAM